MKFKTGLLTFILFFSYTSQAQITSPDTMMHRIFSTLKNKDEKAYVALYPNKEQMMKLMGRLISNLTVAIAKMDTTNKKSVNEAEFQRMMIKAVEEKAKPEQLEKEYGKFTKKFRTIIEQGENKGINWSSIQLSRYTIDTSSAEDKASLAIFGEEGVKTMRGTLYFTSAGKTYELDVREVLYLSEEGGWYGGDLQQLRREGEKEEGVEVIDMQRNDPDAEMPPPPPPAKSKQKTKAKTATTKSKTKTKS